MSTNKHFQPRNISKKHTHKDISDKLVKKLDNSFKEVWFLLNISNHLTHDTNLGNPGKMARGCGQFYSQGQGVQHAQ